MIVFENVTKYFKSHSGRNMALSNVNMHIQEGEFVFILGSSGAGKSTLLRLLLREETATEGRVQVFKQDLNTMAKQDVPMLRRRLGVVFQDFRLIPTMTAYENVAFAMKVTDAEDKVIMQRVPHVLEYMGLGDKMDRLPDELSGGEKQRVALARAIANDPRLVLADEPTGSISHDMALEMMDLLAEMNRQGVTVVVVSHDDALARKYASRIIYLEKGCIVGEEYPAGRPEPVKEEQPAEEEEAVPV